MHIFNLLRLVAGYIIRKQELWQEAKLAININRKKKISIGWLNPIEERDELETRNQPARLSPPGAPATGSQGPVTTNQ